MGISSLVLKHDSHPTPYVVSPWLNRLGSVLFGPQRLALPWTTYRFGLTVLEWCRHALEKRCLSLDMSKGDSFFFSRVMPGPRSPEALLHDALHDRRVRIRQGGLANDDHFHRRGRLWGAVLWRRTRTRGTPWRSRARVPGLWTNFQVH